MIEHTNEAHELPATAREGRKSARHRLEVALATSADEVRAAQRLRYQVFAGELGARLGGREPECDSDIFDPWCEHLVVRDSECARIVGTYRLLTAERAARLGTFYADAEFDLTRLAHLRPRMVEIGRACIHPAYRNGTALMLLWHGIAEFMRRRRYDYLIGCASIGMQDGGDNARRVYEASAASHLAPIEYRVFPRHRLLERDGPPSASEPSAMHVPTLLKGYLRLGAWIGGEPAWDPDFNTADLFVLLPMSRLGARYARHFQGSG